MIIYKGLIIFSLGLNRYCIRTIRGTASITDTYEGGLAEVIALIDEVDNDLKGVR